MRELGRRLSRAAAEETGAVEAAREGTFDGRERVVELSVAATGLTRVLGGGKRLLGVVGATGRRLLWPLWVGLVALAGLAAAPLVLALQWATA